MSLARRLLNGTVDAFVEAFRPDLAPNRRAWRQHGDAFALRSGSAIERFLGSRPHVTDANAATLDDLPEIVARCRRAALDNPIAKAVRRAMVDHVVGTGIGVKSAIDYERLEISEQQARDWEGACDEFLEEARADITGRLDNGQLQRLMWLSAFDGGDVFPSYPSPPTRPDGIPNQTFINLIEAERVETPTNRLTSPNVHGGVQLDKWNRPTGFWVYRGHPGDVLTDRKNDRYEFWPKQRNGRTNIVQSYRQDRVGQARGVPVLHPALVLIESASDYVEETLIAAQMQSRMSLWIETAGNPQKFAESMGDSTVRDKYGEHIQAGMQTGSINVAAKGDSVKMVGPTQPGAYADPFIVRLYRTIGGCVGAPYEVFASDSAAANFSSTRAQFQAWKRTLQCEQDLVIGPWMEWRHIILYEAWLAGKLRGINRFSFPIMDDPRAWTRGTPIRPVLGHIDPSKEASAWAIMLENKLITLQEIVAERGVAWADHVRRLAQERDDLEKAGLSTAPPVPSESEPDEESEDELAPEDEDTEDDRDDDERELDGDQEEEAA